MKIKFTFLVILGLLFTLSSFGVKSYVLTKKAKICAVERNYSDKQIEAFVREVFLDKANELVFNNKSKRLELIKSFLSRFDVQYRPEYSGKKFKNLLEVNLNNKYNTSLVRDLSFIETTFNPLKYNFEMMSKKKQIFRFNNSDYIIVITPIQ